MKPERKRKIQRILFSTLAVAIIGALVTGSSLYAKSALGTTENVHFFVPFPAGKIFKPGTVSQLDGSKIFVKPVVINVDQRGIFKKVSNPGTEQLTTRWLDNIDTKPHRIGLKFTDTSIDIEWDVHVGGNPWDPATQEFANAIGPGERADDVNISWIFHFPNEVMSQPVWYSANLVVFDADSGETLSSIPVKFQQGGGV
jgi:hypothetical protein